MQRRSFNSALLILGGTVLTNQAQAISLQDLSAGDASKALVAALQKGVVSAVNTLGATDGFLGNDKVKIQLPRSLQDAANLLRNLGQAGPIDELITAMNRGAEMAVPQARDLLMKSVQTMSIQDAKGILSGGDTAVSEFFANKTRSDLGTKFLPIITKATAKVGLADKYNQLAGKAVELHLMKQEDANIQQYVTGKTLDGLYYMIAEEEKKIRRDPVSYGSAILSKVFGALK